MADESIAVALNEVVRLAPGIDIVEVGVDEIALVSDEVRLRLTGASSVLFRDQVLAALDGRPLAQVLERVPEPLRDDVWAMVDDLVEAGGLVVERAAGSAISHPFGSMLTALGMPVDAADRLGSLRVGIVGLDGPGAHLAAALASCGVGRLVLIDPGLARTGDLALLPPMGNMEIGRPRQDMLADALRTYSVDVQRPVTSTVGREEVAAALEGCALVAACHEASFGASAHWVNEFALDRGVPAGFARLAGHRSMAGPIVLPGEGPCWMCARMRALACANDFAMAMAYEEQLDGIRKSRAADRPGLPPLAQQAGALLAVELLKIALGLGRPALVGHVHEVDALTLSTVLRPVLQHPDCPACRKKGRQPLRDTTVETAALQSGSDTGLDRHWRSLIDERYGVVRSVAVVPRDPSEPPVPVVVRAELANNRFLGRGDEPFAACSGKGMTLAEARRSALGEACERYAGGRWDADQLIRGRYDELPGPALHPADLVLFAEHQYNELPYAPWRPETYLSWTRSRDWGTGEEVFVPALAVFMGWTVHDRQEFLAPVTSNGLAAGSSLAAAALSATLEVIERDAFMICWLQRLRPFRWQADAVPDEDVRSLAELYHRREVELELYHLPTDLPVHVVLAVGVQRVNGRYAGPAAVTGLAADLDPVRACRKAALEVGQVRPALRARLRDPTTRARLLELTADPSRVADLEDHDLLYADPGMLDQFDFLRHVPPTPFPDLHHHPPSTAEENLASIVTALQANGDRLLVADVSSAELAALGIWTARAVIPGFQPIHFGAREARLGGGRLYELPVRLGHPAATGPTGVNLNPHPLA